MIYLIDPLGTHHRLSFCSHNYVSNIIIHDGLVLFHHGILPNLLAYCLLKIGRLGINDVIIRAI
jgi:hypothetical protein